MGLLSWLSNGNRSKNYGTGSGKKHRKQMGRKWCDEDTNGNWEPQPDPDPDDLDPYYVKRDPNYRSGTKRNW